MADLPTVHLASLFTLFAALLVCTEAAYPLKILGLFPHPGASHFAVFQPVLRGLAEAGHEVTVISHFPDKKAPTRYRDLPLTGLDSLSESVDLKVFENRKFYTSIMEIFLIMGWGKDACNNTLRSEALATVLHERKKYDVILLEQFNSDCMMGVAHVLKAPVVGMSSCALLPWHFQRVGSPVVASYMPNGLLGFSHSMNFFQRVINWLTLSFMTTTYDYVAHSSADAMLRHKFGHDMPPLRELVKNTSLLLVNTHYSLSGVKSAPPTIVEIGGVHIQKAQPLDPELQRFLDNAEHGVVFISWGSMIRAETLPDSKRDAILRAMKRLKQKFVWKWGNSTLDNKPDNVYISKWVPQRDLLCHPNVKVFMTHAGLLGSSEAAYCGVPVVATPMYGDQFLNAATMRNRGMGEILHYEDINENSVIKVIKRMLEKKYMDNAKMISHSYKHRPQAALETAIWWVEYVARTEGAPLIKSAVVDMSAFVYHSLDVHLFLIAVLAASIASWAWIFQKICTKSGKMDKLKRN